MESLWTNDLTIDLARALVSAVAPEELPIFEATAPSYDDEHMDSIQVSDGQIGFGADVITLSVIAIPVAKLVGKVIEAMVVGTLSEGAKISLRDAMKKRLTRGKGPEADPLPADVVQRARSAAFEQAEALGLEADRANLLADAVAGCLTAPTPSA
jgi:hypothetical protein